MPYHPIIDIVRHDCAIAEHDLPEGIHDKVQSALHEVGMDAAASAPYLLQLLGVKAGTASIAELTPEVIRTRTFETLTQMSLKGSQHQPLVLEIEDLHWIDSTSEAYLLSLVEHLAGASIMLLTTYRPGYRPSWLDKSYATQLSCRSLASQDALTVMRSISQPQQLPAHLEQMILEKAEGNPFFLEELTRAVSEQGELRADMTVPDTIQGVLSARIDRLPEAHKRLLQTASVLGRAFSPRLLAAMWEDTETLEALLLELQRLEFLYERTGAAEPMYVFKHALTQEVAYDSLLTTRRQALHLAAGRALELLYADRLEEIDEFLAYHYAKTTQADKAVEYLTRFARKATHGYALAEAVTALQEALRHVEHLPGEARDRRRLDLVLRQARVFTALGRLPETLDLLIREQACVERPLLLCRRVQLHRPRRIDACLGGLQPGVCHR